MNCRAFRIFERWQIAFRLGFRNHINCHPEWSKGSASCGELQIPRFARDDKLYTDDKL